MSQTLRTNYSDLALAKMNDQGALTWMQYLSGDFNLPGVIADGGAYSAELVRPSGTHAPVLGTIYASADQNNLISALTGFVRNVTYPVSAQEKKAREYDAKAMKVMAEAAGSTLVGYIKDLIIAGLIAATPGLTKTLATGYIDFALPSAATNADIVTKAVKPLAQAFNRLRLNAGGEKIIGLLAEDAYSGLESIANSAFKPGALAYNQAGHLQWGSAELYPHSATSFGGASNCCGFFFTGRGYCLKFNNPEVRGDSPTGWQYRGDEFYAWVMGTEGLHGVGDADLIVEIVNPAT